MKRTKPNPQFNRAEYDAARTAPRSGAHKKPAMPLRAPQEELDDATRAAERLGVTRNDLARAALRMVSRSAADVPRGVTSALLVELDAIKERK